MAARGRRAGPVGFAWAAGFGIPCYEVRCWPDGITAYEHAVESPIRLTQDTTTATRVLELVHEVPTPVWGRDELGAGEMWTCNSLTSWLLARTGRCDAIQPPEGGRGRVGMRGSGSRDAKEPRLQTRVVRDAWRVATPVPMMGGMRTYREDMRRAWSRVNSVTAQRLETRFGTIEYAHRGEGTPLLISHGVLGSHVESFDSWWSRLPGPGFHVIAPSRFGYFGSTLPVAASPADQADAYALLLDHLAVDRAVMLAFSAGSGAALEFSRRHSDRVIGSIFACCRLGGGVTTGSALKPLLRLAYGSDRLFWIFKKLLPTAFSRMMGIPKGYRPASAEEADAVTASRELLFPFRPRRDGAVFDGYVSNIVADRFPLEELAVPSLVINARDDPLAPYRFAVDAASRIPAARLVTIEGGGHLFMGHDAEVREAIGAFVRELT